ncbi:MAG: glycine dehydrogenase (aminomethyl-transferring), partial [Corynebacterium sp.]|nr:glycine dehydrogenase (aminomethyl-transferring) [Corynebacterium sp.]
MKFIDRHLGPDSAEREEMLCTLGYENVQDLVRAAIPESIALDKELDLPEALDENTAQERLRTFAQQNTVLKSFYGQGFHDTITPPVIRRGLVEDPAWYTAYTPYQPEISQGRLEALLNFQTMVQDLTGLPIANASLLDESSAVAEAVGLMSRVVKKGRRVVLDSRLHPQILSVAAERARALELEVSIADLRQGLPAKDDLIGVVFAYIGTEGDIADPRSIITEIRERGGLATVTADLLSLLLLEGPGNFDADVVVGSSQRFGVPLFFGGPHAAFMSVTDKLKRQLPGRLVGVSKDADGTPAYRLSLQTREQHIRRERATSNICTAQALLANVASMYAVYHGPRGLRGIAKRVHELAASFAAAIVGSGGEIVSTDFLDTVTVSGVNAAKIKAKLQEEGYLVRAIGETKISVSFGESATPDDVAVLARACGASVPSVAEYELPADLLRTSDVLTHKVFNTIHSETQMMRYLRKLSDKDLALDRTMIPLGSCTMKLNPTAAMEPISWPEFAHIHPFAPSSTTQGWQRLIAELETWLAEVTGYAEVSIQPNAGSQGELAGLLAIRRYHVANGDEDRDIILIPASAHGTNAASATLANLRVVVIKTAADGSIDVADLDEKISQHAGHIAGIMITYPSTHGVFDPEV